MKIVHSNLKISRNVVCLCFDFLSCLSSEEGSLHRFSKHQQ